MRASGALPRFSIRLRASCSPAWAIGTRSPAGRGSATSRHRGSRSSSAVATEASRGETGRLDGPRSKGMGGASGSPLTVLAMPAVSLALARMSPNSPG